MYDPGIRIGLTVSFLFGLMPNTFPSEDIAAKRNPCRRGDFKIGALTYTLYGNGELPPRWASSASNPAKIVYLAELPRPAPALAAYRARPNATQIQFKKDEMMYALAMTDGSARQIFRFYSDMPDDRLLASDMCAAVSGDWVPIVLYDTSAPGRISQTSSIPPHREPISCQIGAAFK